MTLPLPKPHLSYSAVSLWRSSPAAFRARYYRNEPSLEVSPQLEYGKYIADLIKDTPEHPLVAHVPKYLIRDEGFTVEIDGVPLLCYPDSLDLATYSIYEYKTGEWKSDAPAWTQEDVNNWMQLKLYSLAVKTKYGSVNDTAHLIWLHTRMVEHVDPILIHGKRYDVSIHLPELTGDITTFETVITDTERYRAREWFVGAAHEIAEDYKNYLKNV
jgi:hypothetical protein